MSAALLLLLLPKLPARPTVAAGSPAAVAAAGTGDGAAGSGSAGGLMPCCSKSCRYACFSACTRDTQASMMHRGDQVGRCEMLTAYTNYVAG